MSDMTPPPIERDNPYTRALAAIANQNRVAAPTRRPGTVLPPAPPPVTPEELEEARRIDEELWGVAAPTEPSTPGHSPPAIPAATPRPYVAPAIGAIKSIDVDAGYVVGDNGEMFPIHDEERKVLIAWCLNIAQRETMQRFAALAKSYGLEVVNGPETGGDAPVQEVPEKSAPSAVQGREKKKR